jgi:hypothetical protein
MDYVQLKQYGYKAMMAAQLAAVVMIIYAVLIGTPMISKAVFSAVGF